MYRFIILLASSFILLVCRLGVRAAEPTNTIEAKQFDSVPPAKSIASGLLLEPDLQLDWYTREQFVKDMSTVGADKIQKEWNSPVVRLPMHEPSAVVGDKTVRGLSKEEVKAYMVKVKEIFDRGEAIPVSDVGLISTQEDVIRRPMLNHIAAFENESVRVYLLVQKTHEGKSWGYYSIVQDMTAETPTDYFGHIGESGAKIEATSCYKCHSSGPLAIHPVREDLVLDAKLNAALNVYIAEQPRTQFHFPENSPQPKTGQPMKLDACTDCHSEDGERGPLYQVHSHPIRIMVDYGYMPPGDRLSPEDTAKLKAWLDEK